MVEMFRDREIVATGGSGLFNSVRLEGQFKELIGRLPPSLRRNDWRTYEDLCSLSVQSATWHANRVTKLLRKEDSEETKVILDSISTLAGLADEAADRAEREGLGHGARQHTRAILELAQTFHSQWDDEWEERERTPKEFEWAVSNLWYRVASRADTLCRELDALTLLRRAARD